MESGGGDSYLRPVRAAVLPPWPGHYPASLSRQGSYPRRSPLISLRRLAPGRRILAPASMHFAIRFAGHSLSFAAFGGGPVGHFRIPRGQGGNSRGAAPMRRSAVRDRAPGLCHTAARLQDLRLVLAPLMFRGGLTAWWVKTPAVYIVLSRRGIALVTYSFLCTLLFHGRVSRTYLTVPRVPLFFDVSRHFLISEFTFPIPLQDFLVFCVGFCASPSFGWRGCRFFVLFLARLQQERRDEYGKRADSAVDIPKSCCHKDVVQDDGYDIAGDE